MMAQLRERLALSLLLSARTATSAERQTKPAEAEKETAVIVITGTRTAEQSQRAAVKTDVVTREEAERRGATNVAEALQSQPGVQLNAGAYGYLGGVSALQMQGFDRDRVLILEDGERIVGDVGGAIDLSALPTADLSRIEIVSGPSSALYGTSAIGGVVNVITAAPSQLGFSGRLRLEGRTQPGALLQGGVSYRKDDDWVGLDVNGVSSDGIAGKPGLPDLTVPETTRRMVGLRAGTRISRNMDMRVRARLFDDKSEGLESTETPGLGRYLTYLPDHTRRYTFHVIEQIRLGGGSSLRLTLGKQWTHNTSEKDRANSLLGERRDRSHSMQSFESVATIADGKRTWVLGTRFEAEHFSQDLSRTESLQHGPRTTSGEEVAPLARASGALYGQLSWKLHERFTVLPGIRTELHSRYGTALAPRLAMAWRPSDRWMLRASGGRGFRTPSGKELGFIFDHSFYGYRIKGNPDLRPETSWGASADAAWTPSKRFHARAGTFVNWIDQMIDLDLAGGTSSGTVADYSYKNFGKARTAGANVAVSGRPLPLLRTDLSYDYLWTHDDLTGKPLAGRPSHTLTASVQATMGKYEAYLRYRVNGDTYISNELRAPGYQLLDLRAGRQLWPRSQAYVGILNLLDVRQDPGRVGDTRPPLGRVAYIGLRAELPSEEN